MTVFPAYCESCNQHLGRRSVGEVCPRCGAVPIPANDSQFDETVMIPGNLDSDNNHVRAADRGELADRDIHVYRCESLLGAGAMGAVYRAHHQGLERKCALKILSPRVVRDDEDYVARFHNEGRTAAALVHPNIITTHAIGQEDGLHFLEMELIAGEPLQDLVEREGALTPLRATRIATQIADGLAAAHRAGIVHGDLKADNVLLTLRGIPKIADFGLAKKVLVGEQDPVKMLIGTPNYMAPEMFSGTPANRATDVFALGVCYFFMLTGRLPFRGDNFHDLRRSIELAPLPSLRKAAPDASLEMMECLSLLLSKAPANRPRDGIEAAQLLHAVLGSSRDLDSLLKEAFADFSGISWTRDGLKYTVQLVLPDGRRQKVFVEPSSHRTSERLLLIYSLCCPAVPSYYEEALRANSEIAHGALAIREVDGVDYFVMVDAYPRGTVDPEEIRGSILEMGFRADAIEELLTGEDRN